ncbi:MAG: hypothetical protein JXB38_13740, partial [Anaerolineales bacterium]|nr:hypothetical protein [Anaerolineales bacterium]
MKNKKQMACIVFGLIGALLLACGVVGLLVLSSQRNQTQTLDDALTLMLASQTRLYDQSIPVSNVRLPGYAQLAIS